MRPPARRPIALLTLACLTLSLFPGSQFQMALAAEPWRAPRPATAPQSLETPWRDVALNRWGQLQGRIVTETGTPLAGALLVLRHEGREIARTTSDAAGAFTITNMSAGLYEILAASPAGDYAQIIYRVWSADAAPPCATPTAQIVAHRMTVRGQTTHCGHFWKSLTSPFAENVVLVAVAAGIAIPVAINNADDDTGS